MLGIELLKIYIVGYKVSKYKVLEKINVEVNHNSFIIKWNMCGTSNVQEF